GRVDLIEVDVCGRSIDRGVDAARPWAEDVSARRYQVRQDSQVGDASGIGRVGLVSPDALIVVALEVVFAGLFQSFGRYVRMGPKDRIAELRPEAVVLPARVGHHPVEIVEQPPN